MAHGSGSPRSPCHHRRPYWRAQPSGRFRPVDARMPLHRAMARPCRSGSCHRRHCRYNGPSRHHSGRRPAQRHIAESPSRHLRPSAAGFGEAPRSGLPLRATRGSHDWRKPLQVRAHADAARRDAVRHAPIDGTRAGCGRSSVPASRGSSNATIEAISRGAIFGTDITA